MRPRLLPPLKGEVPSKARRRGVYCGSFVNGRCRTHLFPVGAGLVPARGRDTGPEKAGGASPSPAVKDGAFAQHALPSPFYKDFTGRSLFLQQSAGPLWYGYVNNIRDS